jgi:acetyl-CoA synthetase
VHRLESRPRDDRPFWTPADWAWVGGLVDCVLLPLSLGIPVLAWRRRGFQAAAVYELIARHRVRRLFLPPTALHLLARAAPPEPLGVESCHTAGEPLSPEAYAFASRTFGAVYELWGMTEVGAAVGNSPLLPIRPGSMGKPYPGRVVEVLGEDGAPVPAGEVGEIAVRRGDPTMFLGYWRDPEGTRARFRGDWLMTGDLARRDGDGYLFYQGRKDDVFNTAGYRVGPAEIEACLERHSAVARAAVVGAPDPERGQVVKAFLVLRAGHPPSDALGAEIQRFVKDRLAAHEYPRRIVFARELPVTVTGKIRRDELRAAGADERFGVHL